MVTRVMPHASERRSFARRYHHLLTQLLPLVACPLQYASLRGPHALHALPSTERMEPRPVQSRNPRGRTDQRNESDGHDTLHDRRSIRTVAENARVRIFHFDRNYGQSSAIDAGFKHSTGDLLITIDATFRTTRLISARCFPM